MRCITPGEVVIWPPVVIGLTAGDACGGAFAAPTLTALALLVPSGLGLVLFRWPECTKGPPTNSFPLSVLR